MVAFKNFFKISLSVSDKILDHLNPKNTRLKNVVVIEMVGFNSKIKTFKKMNQGVILVPKLLKKLIPLAFFKILNKTLIRVTIHYIYHS